MDWVVYAKRPFAGPQAVLAYLSRYTHRVAISNSRLVAMDKETVTFKWKNYRVKEQNRQRTMTLTHDEFIRRFYCMSYQVQFPRFPHCEPFRYHPFYDELLIGFVYWLISKNLNKQDLF
jgi:hypothetical protein